MISDGELQQMIREAEEQGYSSILPALNELQVLRRAFSEPVAFYADGAYYNTAKAALKDGAEEITPLFTAPGPAQ